MFEDLHRTPEEIAAEVREIRKEEFKPACQDCHHMNGIKSIEPRDLEGAERTLMALIAQDRFYMRTIRQMIESGVLGTAQINTAKAAWSDVHRSMHQLEQLCSHVRAGLAEDWSALEAVTGDPETKIH